VSKNHKDLDDPAKISSSPAFGWFPPHMLRAFKRLEKEIKNVELVVEVRDARLPISSSNPDLVELLAGRPRIILLNKCDLVSPEDQLNWQDYFSRKKINAIYFDSQNTKNFDPIFKTIEKALRPFYAKYKTRSIRAPLPRILIAGLPNVGKSTLINRLVKKKRQQAEARPGVTKSVDWIMLRDKYLLMDSPGILLPRLEREIDSFKLGWISTIRDDVIGDILLATELISYLISEVKLEIEDRYHVKLSPDIQPLEHLEIIGKSRGFLKSGAEVDLSRTAAAVLGDYRKGILGKFVLEKLPR